MKRRRCTPDQVANLIDYNPETGHLTWLVDLPRGARSRNKGDLADRPDKATGRKAVHVLNENIPSTHIIWAIVYGRWPDKYIDHINLDPSDNRLCNLREATGSQNAANRALSPRNSTGHKGVMRLPSGRFRAMITVNLKPIWLGSFATVAEAAEAYEGAASIYFGQFSRT